MDNRFPLSAFVQIARGRISLCSFCCESLEIRNDRQAPGRLCSEFSGLRKVQSWAAIYDGAAKSACRRAAWLTSPSAIRPSSMLDPVTAD
ncbi:MAG: hypothetical protein AB1342_05465 [Pseudomonadota bacterium]